MALQVVSEEYVSWDNFWETVTELRDSVRGLWYQKILEVPW